jgi:purine-nucleoside phosphorylase
MPSITERIDGPSLLRAAVDSVRALCDLPPSVAIILGSGLGGLADRIEEQTVISCAEIPGCKRASASGHRGQLILGRLESMPVVAMAGRLHRYEGCSNDEVAFPVRLMSALGATRLIVSNAAGGISPLLRVGDVVVIRDHINLLGGTFQCPGFPPLPAPRRLGEVYDAALSALAIRVAVEQGFTARPGTYLATLGPSYETRAEIRMMRRWGADVVGMSTVPEVLAAAAAKMRVLGLSIVTNVANPDRPVVADHAQVLEAGLAAEVKLEAIVRAVVGCGATGF